MRIIDDPHTYDISIISDAMQNGCAYTVKDPHNQDGNFVFIQHSKWKHNILSKMYASYQHLAIDPQKDFIVWYSTYGTGTVSSPWGQGVPTINVVRMDKAYKSND